MLIIISQFGGKYQYLYSSIYGDSLFIDIILFASFSKYTVHVFYQVSLNDIFSFQILACSWKQKKEYYVTITLIYM